MPLVGPNYFSLCSSSLSTWLSPENAENAPDGLFSLSPNAISPPLVYLECFNWQGNVPKGYFWDFSNFVIEIYASNQSGIAVKFQTQLYAYIIGDSQGGLSSIKSVVVPSSPAWCNISNTDWNLIGAIPTDIPVGIGITASNFNQTGVVSVDSVRMTVSYNNIDNFFNPPYGVVKKNRRFITKKGKAIVQTRIR